MSVFSFNKAKIDREFEEAYNSYSDSLFKLFMARLSCNEEISYDLTQQTFLIYYEKLNKGYEIENKRAYLYRIADNILKKKYSELKKEKKRNTGSFDELLLIADDKNNEGSILDNLIYNEIAGKIKSVLNEDELNLFKLRYINDLRITEIADCLGISANNCSVKLYRLRLKLKEELEEYFEGRKSND